jgi:hypothetical protein
VAKDDGKSPEAHRQMKANLPGGARTQITSLAVLARADFEQPAAPLLPTPTGDDANNVTRESGDFQSLAREANKLLPTPTSQASKHGSTPDENANGWGFNLWDVPHLLPTPMANPENPGAGGELRAAIVHGEERRNETGVDTMGRPNHGRTPLLPTPETVNRKSKKAMTASMENGRRSGGGNSSPPGLAQIAELRAGRWPKDLPPYGELPPETRKIVDSMRPLTGEPTQPPSAAGKNSRDPHPDQLTIGDA